MSNTGKAREAEGKAEISGRLQGFYCESEEGKGICSSFKSVVNPAQVPVLACRDPRKTKEYPVNTGVNTR